MRSKHTSEAMDVKKLRKDRTERQKLVDKLDDIISDIVVLRDKECVTCGSRIGLGCGHLFSRVAYSTRWDILYGNCNAQCSGCNYRHEYDSYRYTKWFIDKFGQDAYDKLHQIYETPAIFKTWQLKEMYEQFIIIKKSLEGGEK